MEKRCYICGSSRHLRGVCPRRHSVPILDDGNDCGDFCNEFAAACSVQPSSYKRHAGRSRQIRTENSASGPNGAKFLPRGSQIPVRYGVKSFCGVCGKYGHLARDCWYREEDDSALLGWYPGGAGASHQFPYRHGLKRFDEIKLRGKYAEHATGTAMGDGTRVDASRRPKGDPARRSCEPCGSSRDRQSRRGHAADLKHRRNEQRSLTEQSDDPAARSGEANSGDERGQSDRRSRSRSILGKGLDAEGQSPAVPSGATRVRGGDGVARAVHRLASANNNEDSGGLTLDSGQSSVFPEDDCTIDDHLAGSGRRRPRRRPLAQTANQVAALVEQTRREGSNDMDACGQNVVHAFHPIRKDIRRIGRKQLGNFGGRGRTQASFRLFDETVVVCYNCGRSGHKSFDCPESGLNRVKSSK